MKDATFSEIAERIEAAKSIVVVAHVRPDGDAIGSTLALASVLRARGKHVTAVNEDKVPNGLLFLPEADFLLSPEAIPADADLVIALDTSNHARIGNSVIAGVSDYAAWINIDHHISNERYGDLIHVDSDSPATGQIVFELIEANGWQLTEAARDNLYVAISTDTGSFQYPATTARTYEIAAALTQAGANVGKLNEQTYDSYPLRRIQVLRELLHDLKLSAGERCASWALTMEMKDRLGILPDDTENLINLLRGIDSVVVAVFFEEIRGGTVRVSMRSKDDHVDVSEVCGHFGGGGHRLAAGARVEGELSKIQDDVLKKIDETLS